MKKDDRIILKIEDLSNEGLGVGKYDGITFFVKDTVIGDVVEAKVMKMKKTYGYARLMRLIEESPDRVEPPCPVTRQCGGCQIQAMRYQAQLAFKENKVRNNLRRIGGIENPPMEPIIGMDAFNVEDAVAGEKSSAGMEAIGSAKAPAGMEAVGSARASAGMEVIGSARAAAGMEAVESARAAAGMEAVGSAKAPAGMEAIGSAKVATSMEAVESARAAASLEALLGARALADGVTPLRYRNKAQFPIGRSRDGRLIAGFYAGRTHTIIECLDCLLGSKVNAWILDAVLKHMERYGIEPYDEKTGSGLVRHVMTRVGFRTGQIMVCLVVNGRSLPHSEELCATLAAIPGMTSVTLNSNFEKTNVIMGKDLKVLWGTEYIEDLIGDVRFRISPLSFYQVNPLQTQKLYEKVLEYAGLTGQETVWDLYCGIGTISLFLAKKARKVYGVEIVPEAIRDARQNAELNGITNAEFYVGRAEDVLPQKYAEEAQKSTGKPQKCAEGIQKCVEEPQKYVEGIQKCVGEAQKCAREPQKCAGQIQKCAEEGIRADVIVVDPPRKGCEESVLETMVQMQPQRIVYVSCDSATLARDLKYLGGRGYEVQKVCPVDMFGNSVHVETVCLLSKLNVKQHIEVELTMDEMDLTAAEKKATYQEIKDYVLEYTGLKVSSLYIAQVKQKCGIIERENYNKPKSEDAKQPQCPPDKEKAIKEALKHFGMI